MKLNKINQLIFIICSFLLISTSSFALPGAPFRQTVVGKIKQIQIESTIVNNSAPQYYLILLNGVSNVGACKTVVSEGDKIPLSQFYVINDVTGRIQLTALLAAQLNNSTVSLEIFDTNPDPFAPFCTVLRATVL